MFKKGIGKNSLVGLDIGSSSVKAVELQTERWQSAAGESGIRKPADGHDR